MKRIVVAVVLALAIMLVGAMFVSAGAEVTKGDNYIGVKDEFVHEAYCENTDETTSIGADVSYTKGHVKVDTQYVSSEMTASSAELGAGVGATVTDEHTSAHCGVTAEAKLAEAGGMIGDRDYGMVGGSLEIGVGGHLNVDYDDGHVKVDVGAALGFGGSLKLDINVGGIADACSSAWHTFCSWF